MKNVAISSIDLFVIINNRLNFLELSRIAKKCGIKECIRYLHAWYVAYLKQTYTIYKWYVAGLEYLSNIINENRTLSF